MRSGWEGPRAEETLSLRAVMVVSGTGQAPTEFLSSLESSVGYLLFRCEVPC